MRAGLRILTGVVLLLAAVAPWGQASSVREDSSSATIFDEAGFLSGYPAQNENGTINVVVEIPAGTNDKWEVMKEDGGLRWEIEDGRPRIVKYLGYPGNYGMVPSTLLAQEGGGDGDALDVILLGPALSRGVVVRARLLGVLEMLDDGERDDKLIAVTERSPLADVSDMAELDTRYPGVTLILETWFANYKGPDRIDVTGVGDRAKAQAILSRAAESFTQNAAELP